MGFTDPQKLSSVKILGTTPSLLDAHISSLGVNLTTAIETEIISELDRWETSGGKFTKIWPRERNYGVETFPEAIKADIKRNIARLLEWPFVYQTMGMGTLQIG